MTNAEIRIIVYKICGEGQSCEEALKALGLIWESLSNDDQLAIIGGVARNSSIIPQ